MKLVHVTHQFPPETWGGVESYLVDLIPQQQALGHEVSVVTGSHEAWPENFGIEPLDAVHPAIPDVAVYRFHRGDAWFDHHEKIYSPEVSALFTEWLREHRPDVVHVHQWVRLTSNLVECCAKLGIATVVTLHDVYTSCPRAFRVRPATRQEIAVDGGFAAACERPLTSANCHSCVPIHGHETIDHIELGVTVFAEELRAELATAGAVVVAHESVASVLRNGGGLLSEDVTILPLGYRPRFEGVTHDARGPEKPSANDPLRLAYWGGISRHKGVAVLLDAWRILQERGVLDASSAVLEVFGGFESPEFESELRAAASDLPVRFHGAFEPADLAVLPFVAGVFPSTCIETWAIVLDECFELGLPAVVSNRGALARAGDAGWLVEPGNAEALAETLTEVIQKARSARGARRGSCVSAAGLKR